MPGREQRPCASVAGTKPPRVPSKTVVQPSRSNSSTTGTTSMAWTMVSHGMVGPSARVIDSTSAPPTLAMRVGGAMVAATAMPAACAWTATDFAVAPSPMMAMLVPVKAP